MDSASASEILGAAAKGADDGAAVVVDTFTFGYVRHEQSERAQAEAIARGDVVSQIGFGFGKVGARFGQAAVVTAAAPLLAGLLPEAVASSSLLCTATTTASAVSVPFLAGTSYYKAKESYYHIANGNYIEGIDVGGQSLMDGIFAVSSLKSALENAGGCFAAGTPLLTPGGSKLIEELRPGDLVLAAPDNDPERPPEPRVVEKTVQNYLPILNLRVNGQTIATTAQHAFWVRGRGWRDAHQLVEGDELRSDDGRWVRLESTTSGDPAPVFNVRIADYHTYFVGTPYWGFSVWAHNVDPCSKVESGGEAANTEGVRPYEVDTYGNLRSRSVPGDKLTLDHQPSNASNLPRAEAELGRPLTPAERIQIRDEGVAVAVPEELDRGFSPAFGGRNTPDQIAADAANPLAAASRDSQVMVNAASPANRAAAEAAAVTIRTRAGG